MVLAELARVAQSLSSSLETFVPMYSDCQCRWVRSPVEIRHGEKNHYAVYPLSDLNGAQNVAITAIAYCLHAVQLIHTETMAN